MKRSSALLLTFLIWLLLVANSADFLFRQSYYEVWDSAANSLSVIRAKHFAQLYGPYSRWGFCHPGPTLFYVQALGEWLFHDVLHWTQTPFPAQTLAHAAVMTAFFVATLMIFGNWMPAGRPRWWFLCGALVLAVLHFTAMGRIPSYDVLLGPSAFLSMWSAHALVLPFLCLLTAGASVAAGRGEDLPVLALAGGYLLQLHVAQPMFVGPVFVLTYAALLWRTKPGRPWRVFPHSHVVAGLILAFFALPFLIDLCRGSESNLATILRHVRDYHTHKPFERAWFHFLQFGAYTPYMAGDNEFAAYDHAGMVSFLRAHAALYALWALAVVLAIRTLLAELLASRHEGGTPDGTRFQAWAAAFLFLALALTLRWNTRQDGQMFYFNSWFTFAIYYFGALVALAAACTWLRGSPTKAVPSIGECVAGMVAVLAVAGWCVGGLRLVDPSPAATRAMHEDINRVEKASRATAGNAEPVEMLRFDYPTSPVAVAIALQLERDHIPFVTEEEWRVFLGPDYRWSNLPESVLRAGGMQTWRLAHGLGDADGHITTVPYLADFFHQPDDMAVRYSVAPIDPAEEENASIRFLPGGNSSRYIVGGWTTVLAWGTWSNQPRAALEFQPVHVQKNDGSMVEITLIDLTLLPDPVCGATPQRVRVYLDGEMLGAETVLGPKIEAPAYHVPVAHWNHQAAAQAGSVSRLVLEFPDMAPRTAPDPDGPNPDQKPVGIGLREVRFQLMAPLVPKAME